jgi:hypothetical protein
MKQFTDGQIEMVKQALADSLNILGASDNIERFLMAVSKDEINVDMKTEESKEVWNGLMDSFPGIGEKV